MRSNLLRSHVPHSAAMESLDQCDRTADKPNGSSEGQLI